MGNSFFQKRQTKVALSVLVVSLSTVFFFQNCAPQKAGSDFSSASSTDLVYAGGNQNGTSSSNYVYSSAPGAGRNISGATSDPFTAGPTPGPVGSGITYSLSSSYNGAAQTSFVVGQVVYGRVTGVGATSAFSCIDIVGSSNNCAALSGYTAMPNADWSYQNDEWRMALTIPASWGGKSYRGYWYDSSTKKYSPAISFTINASSGSAASASASGAPVYTGANVRDGASMYTFYSGQTLHGKVTGSSANAYSCIDIVGVSNNCSSLSNFTKMPNADWSFSGGVWRSAIYLPAEWSGKSFRGYWYDANTGKMSVAAEFEVKPAQGGTSAGNCKFEAYGAVFGGTAGPDFTCNQATNGRSHEPSKTICRCN